jgi:hypothetical protein
MTIFTKQDFTTEEILRFIREMERHYMREKSPSYTAFLLTVLTELRREQKERFEALNQLPLPLKSFRSN